MVDLALRTQQAVALGRGRVPGRHGAARGLILLRAACHADLQLEGEVVAAAREGGWQMPCLAVGSHSSPDSALLPAWYRCRTSCRRCPWEGTRETAIFWAKPYQRGWVSMGWQKADWWDALKAQPGASVPGRSRLTPPAWQVCRKQRPIQLPTVAEQAPGEGGGGQLPLAAAGRPEPRDAPTAEPPLRRHWRHVFQRRSLKQSRQEDLLRQQCVLPAPSCLGWGKWCPHRLRGLDRTEAKKPQGNGQPRAIWGWACLLERPTPTYFVKAAERRNWTGKIRLFGKFGFRWLAQHPTNSDTPFWFIARMYSLHFIHLAHFFSYLIMLNIQTNLSFLCTRPRWARRDPAFSLHVPLLSPYTQTSGHSSTLSCLIPVNFPPDSQIHIASSGWPSTRAQGPSQQHSEPHREGAASPLNTSGCLVRLRNRAASFPAEQSHALVTALAYPGQRRQVSAIKNVTQTVKKVAYLRGPTDAQVH